MPRTFTFDDTSKIAGGAGSAGVRYEASNNARGSCLAPPLPSLSLRGSIRVGSDLMVTPARASATGGSSFLTPIGVSSATCRFAQNLHNRESIRRSILGESEPERLRGRSPADGRPQPGGAGL